MKINGKTECGIEGMTLSDYLAKNNYRVETIAVEYNGEILPRDMYDKTTLTQNDTIEIVSFVGGG